MGAVHTSICFVFVPAAVKVFGESEEKVAQHLQPDYSIAHAVMQLVEPRNSFSQETLKLAHLVLVVN